MGKKLVNNGEFVKINQHNIHIYIKGNVDKPKIVFMSGSGTVAPVYDFKILYEKLVDEFRVIVIEKFGYGYSDIFETPCDIDTLVSIQKEALEAIGETGPYILAPPLTSPCCRLFVSIPTVTKSPLLLLTEKPNLPA